MAASHYPTAQYTASGFVESAGVILFKQSSRQICLVYSHERKEFLLPKGRRNVGERRGETAVREAREETGFPCTLLPVNMMSRCTPDAEETGFTPDEPRLFEKVCEPFMITHRVISDQAGIKLIYWYMGAVDEEIPATKGEDQFAAQFFPFDGVVQRLTFAPDREIVTEAIRIYNLNFGDGGACDDDSKAL